MERIIKSGRVRKKRPPGLVVFHRDHPEDTDASSNKELWFIGGWL
jgi:hypothetical protein